MTDIAAIQNRLRAGVKDNVDAAVEGTKAMASTVVITPTILSGLAQNAEWLLRMCHHDLEFLLDEDDEDEEGLTLSVKDTRKLPPHLALMAKSLREFSELLEGLETFRAGNAEAAA